MAEDMHKWMQAGMESPATNAAAITPNNSTDLAYLRQRLDDQLMAIVTKHHQTASTSTPASRTRSPATTFSATPAQPVLAEWVDATGATV